MGDTGYLVTVYHDVYGHDVERFVHKNENDAEHEAEVQRESTNVVQVDVEPISIYLGEDTEWVIER